MYKRLLPLTLALITNLSHALTPSTDMAEFCRDRSEKGFAKELILARDNRLSFRNRGGLMNGGVCWWHSRFLRNATYLTVFKPELERPTKQEAKQIAKAIRKGQEVVTIPGYDNLSDFTNDYKQTIQKELEAWQRIDGFVNQQWVVGLWGPYKTTAKNLKRKMDKLYKYVKQDNIAYQKLQIKGIDAHAWLVVDMEKVANGYDLKVIDSNMPNSTNIYRYRQGMTHFNYYYMGPFVPYLGRKAELRRLKRVASKACN